MKEEKKVWLEKVSDTSRCLAGDRRVLSQQRGSVDSK